MAEALLLAVVPMLAAVPLLVVVQPQAVVRQLVERLAVLLVVVPR